VREVADDEETPNQCWSVIGEEEARLICERSKAQVVIICITASIPVNQALQRIDFC